MASNTAPRKAQSKAKKPAPGEKDAGIGVPAAIYALTDPRTGEIRYIGKANDPAKRLKNHLYASKKGRLPVNHWIRKLIKEGNIPQMVVLEWTDSWEDREIACIAQHRSSGNLLNICEGGMGEAKAARVAIGKMNQDVLRFIRKFGCLLSRLRSRGKEADVLIMEETMKMFRSWPVETQLRFIND